MVYLVNFGWRLPQGRPVAFAAELMALVAVTFDLDMVRVLWRACARSQPP